MPSWTKAWGKSFVFLVVRVAFWRVFDGDDASDSFESTAEPATSLLKLALTVADAVATARQLPETGRLSIAGAELEIVSTTTFRSVAHSSVEQRIFGWWTRKRKKQRHVWNEKARKTRQKGGAVHPHGRR
jgi:hypothetical protein